MKIPDSMTEEEVLAIFNDAISKLASRFKFGLNDEDDMRQQAMVFAIEGLEFYDEKQPLVNFIYVHIHNRLYNYKRNNYMRLEKPCTTCPLSAYIPPEGCSAYHDRMECKLYAGWIERNIIKRNLTHTLEYEQINPNNEKNMNYNELIVSDINTREIIELIDKELPIKLRKYYQMMINGDRVNKKFKVAVQEEIIRILRKHKYEI